jgi:lipoprotein-anchoring transpeptidase ErfK/SrfK
MRSALALLSAATIVGLAPGSASATTTQQLLVLDREAVVHSAPSPGATAVARLSRLTPLTGSRSALPIVGRRIGKDGKDWVRVRLPIRPSRSTGWIRAAAGHAGHANWTILVDLSERRATAFRRGKRQVTFAVVVGAPSTPTPPGTYFVTEKLHIGNRTEGPWALATSAYSDVLRQFAGGPGQIALHGRIGLAAPVGSAASHGCVRFDPDAITWLAKHVQNGTTLVIRR